MKKLATLGLVLAAFLAADLNAQASWVETKSWPHGKQYLVLGDTGSTGIDSVFYYGQTGSTLDTLGAYDLSYWDYVEFAVVCSAQNNGGAGTPSFIFGVQQHANPYLLNPVHEYIAIGTFTGTSSGNKSVGVDYAGYAQPIIVATDAADTSWVTIWATCHKY
jgi:hypothetical protein